MYCRKCGKPIPDDSVFCPYCGTSVSAAPVEPVEEVTEEVAEEVIEPVEETIETVEQAVEDTANDAQEAVDEAVEEVVETAEETVEAVEETVAEPVEEAVAAVEETAVEAAETVEEAVEDVTEEAPVETVEETVALAEAPSFTEETAAVEEPVKETAAEASGAMGDPVEKPKKKNNKLVLIIAVVALLLAAGVGGYLFHQSRPAQKYARAQKKVETLLTEEKYAEAIAEYEALKGLDMDEQLDKEIIAIYKNWAAKLYSDMKDTETKDVYEELLGKYPQEAANLKITQMWAYENGQALTMSVDDSALDAITDDYSRRFDKYYNNFFSNNRQYVYAGKADAWIQHLGKNGLGQACLDKDFNKIIEMMGSKQFVDLQKYLDKHPEMDELRAVITEPDALLLNLFKAKDGYYYLYVGKHDSKYVREGHGVLLWYNAGKDFKELEMLDCEWKNDMPNGQFEYRFESADSEETLVFTEKGNLKDGLFDGDIDYVGSSGLEIVPNYTAGKVTIIGHEQGYNVIAYTADKKYFFFVQDPEAIYGIRPWGKQIWDEYSE